MRQTGGGSTRANVTDKNIDEEKIKYYFIKLIENFSDIHC